MLVLSRKVGESIVISESIRITVVQSAKNGRILLGIDAPPEVKVLREELTMSRSNGSAIKNGEAEHCLLPLDCPGHTGSAGLARATPPALLPGTGNGASKKTFAPFSQEGEGPG